MAGSTVPRDKWPLRVSGPFRKVETIDPRPAEVASNQRLVTAEVAVRYESVDFGSLDESIPASCPSPSIIRRRHAVKSKLKHQSSRAVGERGRPETECGHWRVVRDSEPSH